tara:strand:+ start:146 stop:592 length:447 start_codon:yes stop_codon:yes gene_type:complete
MHTATKSSKIDISSEKKLEEFAKKLAQNIKKGKIFFLYGEMGVGKTTFVKYFINKMQLKLNEKTTEVTSPTFNIMNEYILGDYTVKHYDLYRLKSDKELKDLNIFDNNDKEILFIEWPELIQQRPDMITKLYFEYEKNYKDRHIKVLN